MIQLGCRTKGGGGGVVGPIKELKRCKKWAKTEATLRGLFGMMALIRETAWV